MILKILYEDNQLIVAVKPAGVLSQSDGGQDPDMLAEIKAYVKEKHNKPGDVFIGLVHRLDQNVGGVMVFARTSKAAARLSEAIREHEFAKRYYAVVEGGIPPGTTGTLVDRLSKDETTRTAMVVAGEAGREAVLDYRSLAVIRKDGRARTLVDVTLKSGRFHQIRAQFANAGHPLVGDTKYGAAPAGRNVIGLHAVELAFEHPVTQVPLVFRDVPDGRPFSDFTIPEIQ
jgi:23S rRNA pseudouridine1911/1915/1917 synthase